ncbi:MAG: winged helix-turn-helix domain-containing protein [Pyrinomonadaceae bacterium]
MTPTTTRFSFGDFELDAERRLLFRGGETVTLKPKAFDLLIALVENHGRVVSKNDLLDRVWENQFVEENNLTVHVAALRKALGETKNDHKFIVTVPGKGYQFVADLKPRANGSIIIEHHKLQRITIDEEFEVETGEHRLSSPEAQAAPLLRSRSFLSRITKHRIAAGLMITTLAVVMVGGGFLLGPRLSALVASGSFTPRTVTHSSFTTSGVPHRVAIAPDGRSLAYIQRVKGEESLWLADLDTSNSIQITEPSDRLHESLTFAPDGRSLYFTARDDSHLVWTLMSVSIYGGPARSLITGVHSLVSFSPDGKRLAFLRKDDDTGGKLLITADAGTGKDERILLRSDEPGEILGHGVAWSPDGKVIAIGMSGEHGRACEITGVDTASGVANTIGDMACENGLNNLAWLRDGSGLVINRDGDGGSQIWLLSYPLGGVRRITNDAFNYGNYSLSVSNDDKIVVLETRSDPKLWLAQNDDPANAGQILAGSRLRSEGMNGLDFAADGKILYTVRAGGSGTIWEMNADGSDQRQLTASQKNSRDVQINATADNRFLVFESNRSGESEIWRADRNGDGMSQLTSGGGNSQPTLSPDGMQVIYTASRDKRSTLWRVSIEGGRPTQISTEEASWPEVSPDGKFVACLYGVTVDANVKKIAILPFKGGDAVRTFSLTKNGIGFNRLRWSSNGEGIIYKDLVQGLWRQDLKKEKPDAVYGFDNTRVFHFAHSADGRLVYSGGIPTREIVILSNFR